MHPIILILHGLFSLYMGFALSSLGSFFTEKRKNSSVFLVFSWGIGSLVLALFKRDWLAAVLVVVLYFICSGVGGVIARAAIRASISDYTPSTRTPKKSTAGKTVLIIFVILSVLLCAAGISVSDIFGHYQSGYDFGYDFGYDAGHDDGYAEGRRIGINIGKASGYRDGEEDGFLKGQIDYMIRQNSLTKAQKFADECGMRSYFLERMVYYGNDISNW